jgi:DNA-binding transcriptional regulator YiaG
MSGIKNTGGEWDAPNIRRLRQHLGFTQRQLADEMGTRQQTVSEWETGMYQPRGASSKLLCLIAEKANFKYEAGLHKSQNSEPGIPNP